jgi:PAS domain-containing protein
LFARDITVEEDLRHAEDQARALDQALATGSAAAARIDLRGRLASPTPSLAALTGIAAEALAGSRFVALSEPDIHAALAAAIEAVIADGVPRGISAVRLLDRARSPIRIGFSPLRRGAVPDGVAAILIED